MVWKIFSWRIWFIFYIRFGVVWVPPFFLLYIVSLVLEDGERKASTSSDTEGIPPVWSGFSFDIIFGL